MSHKSRVAYAAGDAGINLYFMSTMTFLLYFYTDYFGLQADVAAAVFLVARMVDAVTDPFMGYIADRTRSKWGRFRPYLMFGGIPLAVISVATFTVPDFNETGKIIWAYVTYILFGVLYTVVAVPYAAMTSVLTDDYNERSTLTTYRMAGAFTGALVILLCMPRLASMFGGELGYQLAMCIAGVLGTLLLYWSFAGTKERDDLAIPDQHVSVRDALKVLGSNPPLWIAVTLFVLGIVAFTFRQTTVPYYFKYVMGRMDLMESFLITTLVVMFIGLAVIPKLSARLGKARTVQIGAIVAIVGATGFYLNSPTNVVMVYVWGSIMAIGGAPIAVLGWAMLADTIEYAQHSHDSRADGVIFSAATFFQKTGKAIAGAAIPTVLFYTGFVANQEQQEDALDGILMCIALLPLLVNLLLLVICFTYKLDAELHGRIVDEIKDRLGTNKNLDTASRS